MVLKVSCILPEVVDFMGSVTHFRSVFFLNYLNQDNYVEQCVQCTHKDDEEQGEEEERERNKENRIKERIPQREQ